MKPIRSRNSKKEDERALTDKNSRLLFTERHARYTCNTKRMCKSLLARTYNVAIIDSQFSEGLPPVFILFFLHKMVWCSLASIKVGLYLASTLMKSKAPCLDCFSMGSMA